MVDADVEAFVAQEGAELVGRLDRRDVDDAGAGQALDQLGELLLLVVLGAAADDAEVQVGAHGADGDDARASHRQPLEDVVAHLRRRGGGEREQRACADIARGLAEAEVGGTEVVAPLRDAVRLVDDEEGGAVGAQPLELGAEGAVDDALGRQIEERRLVDDGDFVHDRARGRGRHRRVEAHGVDAERVELVELIVHERDQRRDDHGQAAGRPARAADSRATCRRRSA